jgi:glycosyltransferase involved in cell wall biosynthesis
MPVLKAIREIAIGAARASQHLRLVIRKPKRFLILDPFLTNSLGHNLSFALGFKETCKQRGYSFRVLANRYADQAVVSKGHIHRFFSSDGYVGFMPHLEAFWRRNADFYRELRLLNFANFAPENILLLHTVSVFELFGLARWYRELPAATRPRMVIYVQLGAEFGLDSADEIASVRSLYRMAAKKLAALPNVLICASSNGLLKMFDDEDVSAELFPLPIFWPPRQRSRPDDGRVIFGYFGGARKFKGFHLLVEAIPVVLATVPNADFLICCPYNSDLHEEFAALRKMGARVRLQEDAPAEQGEYYGQFANVDAILNAYDPARYREATSMICLEAIGMGKGVVTTGGTWSDDMARRLGAAMTTMKDFSPEALAEAIVTHTANRREFSSKNEAAQDRVREMHSVDSFLDAIGAKPASKQMRT